MTDILTKHFDITDNQVIFEILMPANDGRFLYYEFINHKIIDKHVWIGQTL